MERALHALNSAVPKSPATSKKLQAEAGLALIRAFWEELSDHDRLLLEHAVRAATKEHDRSPIEVLALWAKPLIKGPDGDAYILCTNNSDIPYLENEEGHSIWTISGGLPSLGKRH